MQNKNTLNSNNLDNVKLNKKNVLIIIVTYNSEKFIEKCLFSIANQNYKNYFLLIIDNNSSDLTLKIIKDYKNAESRISNANFKLICMKKNLGFSKAINYGVFKYFRKISKLDLDNFEYLALVNPDMILDEDAIGNLILTFNLKNLQKNTQSQNYLDPYLNQLFNNSLSFINLDESNLDNVGVSGGMILDYSTSNISHFGGKIQFNFITSHIKETQDINVKQILNKDVLNIKNKFSLINPDYVTGALFATKLDLFIKIGGFDEGYKPAYFEELDYCLKLKKLNYDIVVNPLAFAWHFEGSSLGKFTPKFYYYYHKNRIRCAIINSSFLKILKIFFKNEIIWLKNNADKNQIKQLIKAYLINFIYCLFYMIIKLKNFIKISKLRNQ